jgi:hypothetical protein
MGGSRFTVMVAGAVVGAAAQLKEKLIRVAAHMMETDAGDLGLRDGKVGVRGVPGMEKSFAEIALHAHYLSSVMSRRPRLSRSTASRAAGRAAAWGAAGGRERGRGCITPAGRDDRCSAADPQAGPDVDPRGAGTPASRGGVTEATHLCSSISSSLTGSASVSPACGSPAFGGRLGPRSGMMADSAPPGFRRCRIHTSFWRLQRRENLVIPGRGRQPASPEPMHTEGADLGRTVFMGSGHGPKGPSRNDAAGDV